jgi:hypothetical protein
VAEQSKENLLDDLFPIMERQPPRDHVTKEGITKLLKEINHLAFTLRGFR